MEAKKLAPVSSDISPVNFLLWRALH